MPSASFPVTHDPLEGVSASGTGARRSRVPQAFEPVVAAAVEAMRSFGGNPSLYLYGSVATGMARVGESDVDLVTIGLDPAASKRIATDLGAAHSTLCRSVEVGAAQPSDHEGCDDRAYGNRVFLRHYCVHLTGPVLGSDYPEFAADVAAARGFNGDIGLCAERWRAEARGQSCPVLLGRRIARKTLLAVAGLVSVHDATWTTDRIAAARRWGSVHRRWATALDELVACGMAASRTASPSDVAACLDGVVAAVVEEFRQRIGLWTR